MYGTGTKNQWLVAATSGHAFSADGWSWTYTGVSWGNPLACYNTPEGQGAIITFQDGESVKFVRVARTYLVFAVRQLKGDPIYITNSAQYGNSTNSGSGALNDEARYNLVMPVAQAQNELSI